jgi:hypothetical protein
MNYTKMFILRRLDSFQLATCETVAEAAKFMMCTVAEAEILMADLPCDKTVNLRGSFQARKVDFCLPNTLDMLKTLALSGGESGSRCSSPPPAPARPRAKLPNSPMRPAPGGRQLLRPPIFIAKPFTPERERAVLNSPPPIRRVKRSRSLCELAENDHDETEGNECADADTTCGFFYARESPITVQELGKRQRMLSPASVEEGAS